MMGDDMAIRSGGMYGRPESKYTVATPSTSSGSSASVYGGVLKAGAGIFSAVQNYKTTTEQLNLNLEALQKERLYNVANFKQKMADTLASNKMSFYSSGLDLSSRTVTTMLESNRRALQEDLNMMEYNYNIAEKNIRNQQSAAKRNLIGGIVGSVASIF